MQITVEDYLEHLGVAAALVLSVFVLLGLGLRLKETPPPRMHLWAMIAFFGVNSLDALDSLLYSSVFTGPAWLYGWQDVLIPVFIVSLYFFVRGLTSAEPTLSLRDALHLIPVGAAFLFLLPKLRLPGPVRLGTVDAEHLVFEQRLAELSESGFWTLWIVVLGVYGTLCVRRLLQHKRNIRAVFSDLEGKTLLWLDALVATIFLLAMLVIVDEVRLLLGYSEIRAGGVAMVFDIVLAGSFGLFALRATPPLPAWSQDVLDANAPVEPTPERASADDSRYARSGLTASDLERYAERLERRMADGKLWRNHALNLRGLASEVAIPPIHLSEVLNTQLRMSFYDYVNQYRIQDACDLLAATTRPVLEISETVGFNAKSTFNSSFRKVADQTPTQWRRTHRRT